MWKCIELLEMQKTISCLCILVDDPCQPNPCQNMNCELDRWNISHKCVSKNKGMIYYTPIVNECNYHDFNSQNRIHVNWK